MRKLAFKLSIIEAELDLPNAYKKRVYFNKKFTHSYYSSGNSPATLTLNYSIEYLSHVVFCECVNYMPHTDDFAHFRQKD